MAKNRSRFERIRESNSPWGRLRLATALTRAAVEPRRTRSSQPTIIHPEGRGERPRSEQASKLLDSFVPPRRSSSTRLRIQNQSQLPPRPLPKRQAGAKRPATLAAAAGGGLASFGHPFPGLLHSRSLRACRPVMQSLCQAAILARSNLRARKPRALQASGLEQLARIGRESFRPVATVRLPRVRAKLEQQSRIAKRENSCRESALKRMRRGS